MLSRSEVRAVYDRVGRGQDTQRLYEGAALRDLCLHAGFQSAHAVFELGCGTGAFAAELLHNYLPADARYLGVDLSPTMVDLARTKLAPFADRAAVRLTDGALEFDVPDASFDHFVSNYVVDLLPTADILALTREAHRILQPGGCLGLVSLTHGPTPISHLVSSLWAAIHRLSPQVVGGCRPVELIQYVAEPQWHITHSARVIALGVPSEVLVAEKRATH
jgi:ubiquinone/menaquinone biosynthesis C-methylase UbiE